MLILVFVVDCSILVLGVAAKKRKVGIDNLLFTHFRLCASSSMKFIPLQAFEYINSLLQQVEAQGCLVTVRLEAFTCRMNRGERDLAVAVSGKRSAQVSPLVSPQVPSWSSPMDDDYQLPPASPGAPSQAHVDDRFVYLIAAMNAIHGEADYDFSVLDQADFVLLDGPIVVEEVNRVLAALPEVCAPAIGLHGEFFWSSVAAQVAPQPTGNSSTPHWMSECDFFQFSNHECDPLYERSVWSSHFFIYSKRQRMMVSVMCYGEGNMYRGDDGYVPAGSTAGGRTAALGRGVSSSSRRRGCGGNTEGDEDGEYYHDDEHGRTTIFYPSGSAALNPDERSNATQPTTDDERRGDGCFDDDDPFGDDDGGAGGQHHEQKNRDFYGF